MILASIVFILFSSGSVVLLSTGTDEFLLSYRRRLSDAVGGFRRHSDSRALGLRHQRGGAECAGQPGDGADDGGGRLGGVALCGRVVQAVGRGEPLCNRTRTGLSESRFRS